MLFRGRDTSLRKARRLWHGQNSAAFHKSGMDESLFGLADGAVLELRRLDSNLDHCHRAYVVARQF